MLDVTKFPEWNNFPFKHMLFADIVVRHGFDAKVGPVTAFVIERGENCWHVDLYGQIDETSVAAAVNNLGGCLFEQEYPNEYNGLIERQVKVAFSGYLSERDEDMLKRRKELSAQSSH